MKYFKRIMKGTPRATPKRESGNLEIYGLYDDNEKAMNQTEFAFRSI